MAKKNKFCCNNMRYYIEDDHNLVDYDKSIRSYNLILHNDPYCSHQAIWFCPWCGTKLPKDLDEEWGEVLEKKYHIDTSNLSGDNWHTIPKEMQTDEWWKKRGL